jgi:uncharacterized membrane protein
LSCRDTILSPSSNSFKKALLVEYPRKGMWTIAFQTGDYHGEIEQKKLVANGFS